jgi:murein DD-endopeptidase MepM/ murein hydrolase activator NlpD
VDFYGGRRIVAPEAATVVSTGASGWPEGGGVLLHLASGAYIYIYEGLDAVVKAGDKVAAGQLIGRGRQGGSIEVGYADASGVPLSHAEYFEGKVTKWGRKAAAWLNLTGAPR